MKKKITKANFRLFYNLDQIQHILNHLIEGKKYDGSKLDQDKLVQYKLSLIKIMDQNKAKEIQCQKTK